MFTSTQAIIGQPMYFLSLNPCTLCGFSCQISQGTVFRTSVSQKVTSEITIKQTSDKLVSACHSLLLTVLCLQNFEYKNCLKKKTEKQGISQVHPLF